MLTLSMDVDQMAPQFLERGQRNRATVDPADAASRAQNLPAQNELSGFTQEAVLLEQRLEYLQDLRCRGKDSFHICRVAARAHHISRGPPSQ